MHQISLPCNCSWHTQASSGRARSRRRRLGCNIYAATGSLPLHVSDKMVQRVNTSCAPHKIVSSPFDQSMMSTALFPLLHRPCSSCCRRCRPRPARSCWQCSEHLLAT